MPEFIRGFRGGYVWLSNFYPVPHLVYGYPTVEHYFQAMKTESEEERHQIMMAQTPTQAKRLGRKVTLRSGWIGDDLRNQFMYLGLEAKFAPGTKLARMLKETGDAYLEETNTWNDTYWGVCHGRGLNRLGHLLMDIRKELNER